MHPYDLAIIGAGWAGISAARQAHANGLKVCLIEKDSLGGVCLNRGCIPTKVLIQSASVLSVVRKAAGFGITASVSGVDYAVVRGRVEKVVSQLRNGLEFLLKGVEVIHGAASFLDEHTLQVQERTIRARDIIIATGSRPLELPGLAMDGKEIVSSDELLLSFEPVKRLLIIGAGYIGCECASLFRAFGSEVVMIEKDDRILPMEDPEISRKLSGLYARQGIGIECSTDARTYNMEGFDKVLLAAGRSAFFGGLDLDKAGVKLTQGRLPLNEYLQTPVNHIYAAGDCTEQIMLAHYAAFQGRMIVANILCPDKRQPVCSSVVPGSVFSHPEAAGVGVREEQARAQGIEYTVHRFDYRASAMAQIRDEAQGFIKIISRKETGEVIGACLIGPSSTELISLLTLAVSNKLTVEQVSSTIFPHPGLAEAVGDSLNSDGAA